MGNNVGDRVAEIRAEIEKLEQYLDDLEYADGDETEASREAAFRRINILERELAVIDQ
jgi:hypothetical protein